MRSAGLATSSVDVAMHLYPGSVIRHRVYPGEDRATVHLRGTGGEVTVFAEFADLVRLWGVLGEVLAELDGVADASGPGSAA